MTFPWSTGVSLYACIRTRNDSRSICIVDRKYVFTLFMVLNDLSGVAVDTGMVHDGNGKHGSNIRIEIFIFQHFFINKI